MTALWLELALAHLKLCKTRKLTVETGFNMGFEKNNLTGLSF